MCTDVVPPGHAPLEIPPLPRLRDERQLDVVPFIVGDCAWRHVSWLAAMQARPKNGQALESTTKGAWNTASARIAEEVGAKLARAAKARAVVAAPAVTPAVTESSDGPTARLATPAGAPGVPGAPASRVEPAGAGWPAPVQPPARAEAPVDPLAAPSPTRVRPPVSNEPTSRPAEGLAQPGPLSAAAHAWVAKPTGRIAI